MRHYYACLEDKVYIFEKKRDRDRFCVGTCASRIFAYNRIHCKEFIELSPKEVDAEIKLIQADLERKSRKLNKVSVSTQNEAQRAINQRLRAFNKNVSK